MLLATWRQLYENWAVTIAALIWGYAVLALLLLIGPVLTLLGSRRAAGRL